jgi:hypothetical protein
MLRLKNNKNKKHKILNFRDVTYGIFQKNRAAGTVIIFFEYHSENQTTDTKELK